MKSEITEPTFAAVPLNVDPDRVEVVWSDTCSIEGWRHKEEAGLAEEDGIILSVGYVYEDSKEALTIVSGYGKNNYDHTLRIPKHAVLEIRPLKRVKQRG